MEHYVFIIKYMFNLIFSVLDDVLKVFKYF